MKVDGFQLPELLLWGLLWHINWISFTSAQASTELLTRLNVGEDESVSRHLTYLQVPTTTATPCCARSELDLARLTKESPATSKLSESPLSRDLRQSSPSDSPTSSEHEIESHFDNTTSTNVTAQLDTTAYLHCRVRQLGERTVSWIRRSDFHILTVGLYTYSSDQRFQMINIGQSEDWTLQIRYVKRRDEGLYECQVSSDPPISLFVTLNVVVPQVDIVGSPEMYAQSGSTITLVCHITQSPEPPVFVFWYHNDRMISYDQQRGGITVNISKGSQTSSTLTIRNALGADSGNYTCSPSGADPASILVHVLNGEKPAAMQHDGKARGFSTTSRMSDWVMGLLLFLSTVYFGLR